MSAETPVSPAPRVSPWSPLAVPVFRALWIATVVSNVGQWMHEVGAGWLMTTLTDSTLLVALVQTAVTLPFFLFALPAGGLTDLVNRRVYLIWVQAFAFVVSSALAVIAWLGGIGPMALLGFTFLLGVANALTAPAWQAIVPELVPRRDLPAAVALNGVGINISRAIGPAIGGLLVAVSGPAVVFAGNAVSFLGILWVLVRWRRPVDVAAVPAEHFGSAMVAGLRFVRHSRRVQTVLLRVAAFVAGASATWALLPLVARRELGVTATGYGVLLGALGLGAVGFASQLGAVKARLTPRSTVAVGAVIFVGVTLALALVRHHGTLVAVMLVAGAAWLAILASLNVGIQAVLPSWVRGRALAVYLLVFNGGMAVGSMAWGAVAGWLGVTGALLAAAGFQVVTLALTHRLALPDGGSVDLEPSRHWPESVLPSPEADDGRILVIKTYRVAPAEVAAFRAAAAALREVRLRDGALEWGVFADPDEPELRHEIFVHANADDHRRSHERFSREDRGLQEALLRFHRGGDPPRVRHLRQVDVSRGA